MVTEQQHGDKKKVYKDNLDCVSVCEKYWMEMGGSYFIVEYCECKLSIQYKTQ